MLGLVLTFAVDYLPYGDYPRLYEMVKEGYNIPFSIPKGKSEIYDVPPDRKASCPVCGPCRDAWGQECNLSYWYVDCYMAGFCIVVCIYEKSAGFCEPKEPGTQSYDIKSSNMPLQASLKYIGFYQIYDINGRKVYEGRLNGKLPPLKKGVYFLKGRDGKVRKVVVR